jgi:uncharacterized protein
MNDYFRWSFRQFYLLYCWPSQFKSEMRAADELRWRQVQDNPHPHFLDEFRRWKPSFRYLQNLSYLLKLFPTTAGLVVGLCLVGGGITEALGFTFYWVSCGMSLSAVITLGPFFLAAFRREAAIGICGAGAAGLGIAVGVGFGVTGAFALGVACGLVIASLVVEDMVLDLGVETSVVGCVIIAIFVGATYVIILALASSSNLYQNIVSGLVFAVGFLLSYLRILSYPIDLTLAIASYQIGKSSPHAAKRAWRWSPISWNDMIWLPVPFAGKLLASLARIDREEGFHQIKLFARERALERRVAITAVAEIAVGDLEATTMDRLANIPERIEWTIHPPVELLNEFLLVLPRVHRMAQHAMQYITLSGAHRKRRALRAAVEEVGTLHNELSSQRGRFVPRLLHVSNQWRRILEEETRLFSSRGDDVSEIPNPFVFGNAIVETENNIFVGRRDIVRKIEASILNTAQAPTLLLHGARRMGKTSILNQLPRLMGADIVPVIIDCQNPAIVGSEAILLRYFTAKICDSLSRRRVEISLLKTDSDQPFAGFDDWLRNTDLALPTGMRVLLCLDEYERLQQTLDDGWGVKVLDELRHILQHHHRFILMFSGAHSFHELGPTWTDRFINARSVRVSFLEHDEVLLLLTQPIPDFDLTYAPGALDALIDATRGQPFLTQAVACELVDFLNERHRTQATCEDVEKAITRAIENATAFFNDVWSNSQQEGQQIMLAIAGDIVPPAGAAASRWLRENDVLNDDGKFAVPMMKMWVKQKAVQVR